MATKIIIGVAALILIAIGVTTRSIEAYKNLPTREEFLKLCGVGDTKAACLERKGRPDATQMGTGSDEYWYYRSASRDKIARKPDAMAQIIFKDGVVERVNFN
jgi:hypothetical protein